MEIARQPGGATRHGVQGSSTVISRHEIRQGNARSLRQGVSPDVGDGLRHSRDSDIDQDHLTSFIPHLAADEIELHALGVECAEKDDDRHRAALPLWAYRPAGIRRKSGSWRNANSEPAGV